MKKLLVVLLMACGAQGLLLGEDSKTSEITESRYSYLTPIIRKACDKEYAENGSESDITSMCYELNKAFSDVKELIKKDLATIKTDKSKMKPHGPLFYYSILEDVRWNGTEFIVSERIRPDLIKDHAMENLNKYVDSVDKILANEVSNEKFSYSEKRRFYSDEKCYLIGAYKKRVNAFYEKYTKYPKN